MKSVTYQIPIPWEKEQPCLHRLIRQIQTRPGMYIGSNALTSLSHFLNGYRAAERDLGVCWHGILFPLDFQFMHSFTDARLHTECVCAGWCRNMLTFCHGDEEKALNLFFALYQEFVEVEMKRYWRTILTKENIARNNKMEHCCLVQSSQGRQPQNHQGYAVAVIPCKRSRHMAALLKFPVLPLRHGTALHIISAVIQFPHLPAEIGASPNHGIHLSHAFRKVLESY